MWNNDNKGTKWTTKNNGPWHSHCLPLCVFPRRQYGAAEARNKIQNSRGIANNHTNQECFCARGKPCNGGKQRRNGEMEKLAPWGESCALKLRRPGEIDSFPSEPWSSGIVANWSALDIYPSHVSKWQAGIKDEIIKTAIGGQKEQNWTGIGVTMHISLKCQ